MVLILWDTPHKFDWNSISEINPSDIIKHNKRSANNIDDCKIAMDHKIKLHR